MISDSNSDDTDRSETAAVLAKQERLKAARRTRTSAAVVAISFLATIGYCTLKFAAQGSPLAMQVVLLVAFLGVALLMMEPSARFQRANELRILRFYKSPRFYGIVISSSAGMVLAVAFLFAPAAQVRARHVQPVMLPEPAPAPPQPPEFPPLNVSGVIINGKKSSALINGRTVAIEERIDDVQLVEVREDGITVELHGYRRFIPREKAGAKSLPGTTAQRR